MAVCLVEKAAALCSFSGIPEILRLFVDDFHPDGCVLWQIAEGAGDLAARELIAVAQYFEGEEGHFWHHIAMRHWTGRQILEGKEPQLIGPEAIEQLVGREPNDPDVTVLSSLGVKSFAIIPIYRGGRPWGALNLYKRGSELDHSVLQSSAVTVARLIPQLVEDIARRTGVELLSGIRNELRGRGTTPSAEYALQNSLQMIVEKIQKALNALEVSIYLEDDRADGRALHLEATNWPWPDTYRRTSYKPGEGLTGYCYSERKSVRIPDLARLQDNDRDRIKDKYPGIVPQMQFNVDEIARTVLPQSRDGKVPPISWLGAPLVDDKPVGVLRVCGMHSGPYYFNKLHEELLVLVADQIGEWIANQRRLANARREYEWLRKLVQGMTRLNQRVQGGLTSERLLKDADKLQSQFLNATLDVANEAIPNAESFSVRLAEKGSLRFKARRGNAWSIGTEQEKERRYKLVFPLTGPEADTVGARVFAANETIHKQDLHKEPPRFMPFPETRSLIVAPVSSGDRVFGTIDVRSDQPNFFTEQAVQVTELLGRQLGLYLFLSEQVSETRTSKARLAETLEQQRETFENLAHQLRTPVYLSVRWSGKLLESVNRRYVNLGPETTRLRAICRRTEQVVANITLFADLARGATINVSPVTITAANLINQIKDSVNDHALLLNPEQGITVAVDENSLRALEQVAIRLDPRLLDQMISNLIENASKYSFPKTQVLIKGGLARNNQYFFIAVLNRGVRIGPEEAKRLAERGSRSDRALKEKKEGSGLGLYLVREMLHAQKGQLEIQPTNPNGVTEVRLLLPSLGKDLNL